MERTHATLRACFSKDVAGGEICWRILSHGGADEQSAER